jgi:hypothetical protein
LFCNGIYVWAADPYLQETTSVLPRDGAASTITGYGRTTYQAIRYEPICGTLDESFTNPISVGRCTAVMDIYSNNTKDTLALYDETGVRLNSAIVGGGVDLCMCFALSTTANSQADLCWWVSGSGQEEVWWTMLFDNIVAGTFRPGSAKSLPQCGKVDLPAIEKSWSATAAKPTNTESVGNESQSATAVKSTNAESGKTASVSPTATSRPGNDKSAQTIGLGAGTSILVIIIFIIGILVKKNKNVKLTIFKIC